MRAFIGSALLLAASMASCSHAQDPTTGTTTVEGQVVESTSRQPVGGATVQVYQAAKGYRPGSD